MEQESSKMSPVVIIVVIVIIALAIWYFTKGDLSNQGVSVPASTEQGSTAEDFGVVENPVEELPDTNPFTEVETNPFKSGGYKNPFGN